MPFNRKRTRRPARLLAVRFFMEGTALLAALLLAVTPAVAGNPRPTGPSIEVPGELVLFSLSSGATVEVDGKIIGTVPLSDSLVLLPGTHTIRIKKRGHTTITETFKVGPGETVELELDVLPFAGLVKVNSSPVGASVKVDGKVIGVTPLDEDIAAGKRVLTVSLPGYTDEVREVEIRAAEEVTFDFALAPMVAKKTSGDDAFYETWWFWTLVGVAGAGTAAAVIATSGGEVTPTPNLTLTIP